MRLVDFPVRRVEPEVMASARCRHREAARQAGALDGRLGLIEITRRSAVQVLAFLDHFKISDDDPG